MNNKAAHTGNLRDVLSIHVQHDGTGSETGAQLKERVQGERGHVRLGPPLSSLFHILLVLHPPAPTDGQPQTCTNAFSGQYLTVNMLVSSYSCPPPSPPPPKTNKQKKTKTKKKTVSKLVFYTSPPPPTPPRQKTKRNKKHIIWRFCEE